MTEPADQPAKPLRTWRPMALWTAGILAALGLAWFVAAVAVPVWKARTVVLNVYDQLCLSYDMGGLGVDGRREASRKAAIKELGGPELAAHRLGLYLSLPEWTDAKRPLHAHFRRPRDEAFEMLGVCGRPALSPLIRSLSSPGWRYDATWALGRIGPEAAEAAPFLADVLKDENRHGRWAAARALGRIGPGARAALPALVQAAEADAEPFVRAEACASLGLIGDLRAVEALVRAQADTEQDVRDRASDALTKIRGQEPPK